jgi:hypothetical protein
MDVGFWLKVLTVSLVVLTTVFLPVLGGAVWLMSIAVLALTFTSPMRGHVSVDLSSGLMSAIVGISLWITIPVFIISFGVFASSFREVGTGFYERQDSVPSFVGICAFCLCALIVGSWWH